jgi:hypothetical protein
MNPGKEIENHARFTETRSLAHQQPVLFLSDFNG